MKQAAASTSWRNRPMPDEHAILELDGVFSAEHFAQLQLGYIPQTPQDKWFFYHENGWLNIFRSQTGSCIFKLQIKPNDDHFVAPIVVVNRHPKQYRSITDQYDVQLMAYLIDRYLLGRSPTFPPPPKIGRNQAAQYQQHMVGEIDKKPPSSTISLTDLLGDL